MFAALMFIDMIIFSVMAYFYKYVNASERERERENELRMQERNANANADRNGITNDSYSGNTDF